MKVLVTGATGFIGAGVCRGLVERNCELRVLVLNGEDVSPVRSYAKEIHYGDITVPATLKGIADGVDTVFHLAARVTDWGPKKAFYAAIFDGTRNLVKECEGRVERFVFVSSIAACGIGGHLKGFTERDEPRKSGVPYNDAKLDTERFIREEGAKGRTRYTIVRPSNVTGPGSVWVKDIIERYRGLFVPLIDEGRYSASLVYVDNLVDGIIRAGTMKAGEGKTYQFRDDWNVTWKQYVTDLGAIIGKKPMGSIPFSLAWYGGGALEAILTPLGVRAPITRLAAGCMGRDNDVDTSLARNELGWKTEISYNEAMTRIARWVREYMS